MCVRACMHNVSWNVYTPPTYSRTCWSKYGYVWRDLSNVCVSPLLQAHMLVCRALSNMLLLPWSNLPESEQQWQTRSSSHASLLAALTRHYRLLSTANQPPHRLGLEDSQLGITPFINLTSLIVLITLPSTVLFRLVFTKKECGERCDDNGYF